MKALCIISGDIVSLRGARERLLAVRNHMRNHVDTQMMGILVLETYIAKSTLKK